MASCRLTVSSHEELPREDGRVDVRVEGDGAEDGRGRRGGGVDDKVGPLRFGDRSGLVEVGGDGEQAARDVRKEDGAVRARGRGVGAVGWRDDEDEVQYTAPDSVDDVGDHREPELDGRQALIQPGPLSVEDSVPQDHVCAKGEHNRCRVERRRLVPHHARIVVSDESFEMVGLKLLRVEDGGDDERE
jgi:hypothetical protein